MKEGYEEELADYTSDNCPESKIFVAPYPLAQGGVVLETDNAPAKQVDQGIYGLADMETSLSGLDISQPRATVTEGFINPIEGSSTPFLSIPSPIDLPIWNGQHRVTEVIQGGEGLC